jgi:hypothetical protein
MSIAAGTSNLGGRLVMLGLGLLFAWFVVQAVRTGRVKPSRYDRFYTRAEDPGTFWFHVFVFAVLACGMIAVAVGW